MGSLVPLRAWPMRDVHDGRSQTAGRASRGANRFVRRRAGTGGIFRSRAVAEAVRPVASSGDLLPARHVARSGHVDPTVTASAPLSRTATPTAAPTTTKQAPTATGTPSATSFQNTPVATLDARTMHSVASGRLDSKDSAPETVPANHPYLVCLALPPGWKPAGGSYYRLPGWICRRLPAAVNGGTVTFPLRPASGGTG